MKIYTLLLGISLELLHIALYILVQFMSSYQNARTIQFFFLEIHEVVCQFGKIVRTLNGKVQVSISLFRQLLVFQNFPPKAL